ncbi:hypothetical protein PG996_011465 [Apiospora saccharicola]|uniref:Uncharacterized protein n=1 Tax=Apiospora saccharicola TaxID=335842 RepID=A0ABR1UHZ2_9PEZI
MELAQVCASRRHGPSQVALGKQVAHYDNSDDREDENVDVADSVNIIARLSQSIHVATASHPSGRLAEQTSWNLMRSGYEPEPRQASMVLCRTRSCGYAASFGTLPRSPVVCPEFIKPGPQFLHMTGMEAERARRDAEMLAERKRAEAQRKAEQQPFVVGGKVATCPK